MNVLPRIPGVNSLIAGTVGGLAAWGAQRQLAKLRERIVRDLQTKIILHVRSHYSMAKVSEAAGLFNFRCHLNCVQWVRDHGEDAKLIVVEVMAVEGSIPYVHYLVYDEQKDQYIDPTLGWKAPSIEFYEIRTVHPSDYERIMWELDRSRAVWTDKFATRFQCFVLGDETVC